MALVPGGQTWCLQLKIVFLPLCLVAIMAEETRECREQEYKDQYGNCMACKQCDAGQELSKECGFGYGEDAECVPCRAGRFKEDGSLQKCKPCLHCTLLNRFQKANCSSMKNAVCGDCLPGFYRKTKLSGFQDMECVPCGDPPPPYEPHCSGRVNLVPIPSTVSSPRDVALAAVICSALATVLLALFILCVIYCRRQLLEKKPASLRTPEGPFSGEELSCLDRRQVLGFSQPPCCHCPRAAGPTCGPVLLIPSMCCEDRGSQGHRHPRQRERGPFQPQGRLSERHVTSSLGSSQDDVGKDAPAEFFEVWQLMADTEDRCDPQLHLRSPQPTDNNSLEEEEDDCSGLLHTEGISAVPLHRDGVLVSQHVSVVQAPVCP